MLIDRFHVVLLWGKGHGVRIFWVVLIGGIGERSSVSSGSVCIVHTPQIIIVSGGGGGHAQRIRYDGLLKYHLTSASNGRKLNRKDVPWA
jgi:hypothetical protein